MRTGGRQKQKGSVVWPWMRPTLSSCLSHRQVETSPTLLCCRSACGRVQTARPGTAVGHVTQSALKRAGVADQSDRHQRRQERANEIAGDPFLFLPSASVHSVHTSYKRRTAPI